MIRWSFFSIAVAACGAPSAPRAPILAAPLVPSAAVEPTATTARDNIVVRSVLDRTEGVCAWMHYWHVEAFAVDSGKLAWSLPAWARLVAELPDGDLLVTNEGFDVEGPVRGAVVRRSDGTLRATCDGPITAGDLALTWAIVPGGLVAAAYRMQAPSGIEQERPPPEPSLLFTTSGDACSLTALDSNPGPSSTGASSTLLAGTRDLSIGDVTIREVIAVDGDPPSHTLIADRGGRTLWRRGLVPDPYVPCKLP